MNIKLKNLDTLQISNAADIYAIMQKILLRENRIDRNREHLWTVSLDSILKILNIELVSMGSINQTVVEPMEVFSVPLQKRAVSIMLIHNHPSQQIQPSEPDKDMTDRMIQCGLIMHVPVIDHLVISETSFYSFAESGLLQRLQKSTKYVPDYVLRERLKKEVEEVERKKERDQQSLLIARTMKENGYSVEEIMKLTGLSKQSVQQLK